MDVLVTGAYGRCGTAIIDHLHDDAEYEFTYLNRSDRPPDHQYGGFDTHVVDVADYDAMRPSFDDRNAVIHLAAYPRVNGSWTDIFEPNIVGMYNALEAASEAKVESFVFGSTNHVLGTYETEFAPAVYDSSHDLLLDHTDPVRPDSYYGTSKSFGEDLGRYYVENNEYPRQFYSLRICSVRNTGYDHPFGDAERGVENGDFERDSIEYERSVARMKAMWHSRRDFAHQIERCLLDDDVSYGIFNGVSDNDRRWFSIQHAKEVLGYRPEDNGDAWDEPPS